MDPTDQEQEARRQRLRAWVASKGGHAQVVRAHNLTPAQASYLSQVCGHYSFASRAARNMERRLGMPERWLDLTTPAQSAPSSGQAPPPRPDARFTDRREVTESDWALLNDIKTAMESPRLAAQVEELRREAQAMEAFAAKHYGPKP